MPSTAPLWRFACSTGSRSPRSRFGGAAIRTGPDSSPICCRCSSTSSFLWCRRSGGPALGSVTWQRRHSRCWRSPAFSSTAAAQSTSGRGSGTPSRSTSAARLSGFGISTIRRSCAEIPYVSEEIAHRQGRLGRSAALRKLRVRLVLLAVLVQMSLVRRTLADGHSQLRLLPGLHLDRLVTGRSEGRPDDGVPGAAGDPLDLEATVA